jgi:hypothetical protein
MLLEGKSKHIFALLSKTKLYFIDFNDCCVVVAQVVNRHNLEIDFFFYVVVVVVALFDSIEESEAITTEATLTRARFDSNV